MTRLLWIVKSNGVVQVREREKCAYNGSLRFFSPSVILQFFIALLLARSIQDNTRNYTVSALRVCNRLNVVPVGVPYSDASDPRKRGRVK